MIKIQRHKAVILYIMFISIFVCLILCKTSVMADNGVSTVYNGVDYSFVYDYNYYISRYSDVKNVFKGDPQKTFWHFINYGMKEGRQAKANFNVHAYKNRYSDLQRAYGNNLPMYYIHYCVWGNKEGRSGSELDYNKVFNAKYYADKYPDLKKAFGYDEVKLLNHYLKYGINEGRSANSVFGINIYKSIYRDLQIAYGSNNKLYVEHYIRWGCKENRIANADYYTPIFDAIFYANKYSDLKNAFGYDEVRLFSHFINYGMREGRQASPNFNQHIYKKNYEDLRNAFGNDNTKYYIHFLKYGIREKRNAVSLVKNNKPDNDGQGGNKQEPINPKPEPVEPEPQPVCNHEWVWHTHTETVHHSEEYLVSEPWDEPVYENHSFCNGCGTDLTATYGGATTDAASIHLSECGTGYHSGNVQVGSIHHDAEYATDEWDTYEEVKDYQYCSKCGERK